MDMGTTWNCRTAPLLGANAATSLPWDLAEHGGKLCGYSITTMYMFIDVAMTFHILIVHLCFNQGGVAE